VARGFTQTYRVDYNETFAPVAKFTSIRCILALAALEDMEIHQMDMKTAFLNGELEKEIYMEQPQGFMHQGGEQCIVRAFDGEVITIALRKGNLYQVTFTKV